MYMGDPGHVTLVHHKVFCCDLDTKKKGQGQKTVMGGVKYPMKKSQEKMVKSKDGNLFSPEKQKELLRGNGAQKYPVPSKSRKESSVLKPRVINFFCIARSGKQRGWAG